jgi:hypothetical protein
MRKAPISDKVRILLVHGMAGKPAEPQWFELWRRALMENLLMEAGRLAQRLKDDSDLLVSAYWADAIPDHLPELADRLRQMRQSVDNVVESRRRHGRHLHTPREGWNEARVRRFGVEAIESLRASLSLGPEAFRQHLWELERYHADSLIADRIRRPLENRLRECWEANRRVIIISHSLGAAVAYDTLWRFSHRSDPEFRSYRQHTVDLLVTMGAPLADRTIQNVMLSGRWLAERDASTRARRRRAWMTNVQRWDNYSALGDFVCHGLDMEKEFFSRMRQDLPHLEGAQLRDYRDLFNPYREADGTPNPHKVFGYLVQPKLATRLCRLLRKIDAE